MSRAARKASEKLAVLKVKMPAFPFELAIAEQPPATAGKPAAIASLAPKIIRYVEGKPVMSQDVVETKLFAEHYQWGKFFDAKDGSHPLQDEADKATVLVAVLRLAARVPRPDVALVRGDDRKLRVMAGAEFKPGQLVTAPLVQGISRLSTRTTQAWAVRASVTRAEDSEPATVFIVGGSTCPPHDCGCARDCGVCGFQLSGGVVARLEADSLSLAVLVGSSLREGG